MTLTLPPHPYVSASVLFLRFPRRDVVVAGRRLPDVYRDRRRLAAVSDVYRGRRLRLYVAVDDRVLRRRRAVSADYCPHSPPASSAIYNKIYNKHEFWRYNYTLNYT
jgi:hypothetical protein